MVRIVQFPLRKNAKASAKTPQERCIVSSLDEYRKERALRSAFEAIACRDGEECKERLLEAFRSGLSPNSTDSKGWTLLYFAVWKSNRVAMETIISAGADVNKPVESELGKDMPLCLACEIEDLEAAEFLLKRGANAKLPRVDAAGKEELAHEILRKEAFSNPPERVEEFVKKLTA